MSGNDLGRDRAVDPDIEASLKLLDEDFIVVDPSLTTPPPYPFDAPSEPVTSEEPEGASETTRTATGNRARSEEPAPDAASEIAKAHGLSLELARHVADGRCTLATAIVLHRRSYAPAKTSTPPAVALRRAAGLGTLALLLAGFGWSSWKQQTSRPEGDAGPQAPAIAQPIATAIPAEVEESLVPAAHVETGPGGVAVRISGPSPEAVLLAYCKASVACTAAAPLHLAETDPPSEGVRVGLYVDALVNRQRAIFIHRHRKKRIWVAGDGSRLALFDVGDVKIGPSLGLVLPSE